MNAVKTYSKEIAPKQKLIFKLITFFIPFLILLLFEGLLRITGYGDKFDLFIQNPTEGYGKYMMVNPEIGKKYFQKLEYTDPANDIFLKEKPENTFRLFVMGSSVVYGFPYDRNLMFSRILHHQLEESWQEKNIEVVNTAITAINSFTLLDYTDEILRYQPDAILIYAGHNEFYGAFGIGSNETMSRNRGLTRLHIALLDLRMYQMVRNIISGAAQKIASGKNDEVHGTLMKRIVADSDILLYSEEYTVAMERYRQNMEAILKKANKKKVPVFLSELVSNVKDMEPFNSKPSDTLEAAIDVYHKARIAEKNQDFGKALELFYRAKDLDCIRFRASEDVNRILNELIREYGVYRVPMLSWFQEHSRQKLIGDNYMTEHVHPNIEGSFLMAEAFYSVILTSGILGEPDQFTQFSREYYKRNWGYTALDSLLAHHRVALLKGFWPFVKEESSGADYRKFYKPRSYIDSLAFRVLKFSELSLAEVRLELAEKYEASGQTLKAYKEYEALLRMNPYIALNYRDAAQCLLQLSDLLLAMKYFQKSLEYEESFFARFRIAEIYLLKGDYSNAIRYFEESFSLAPEDNKLNVAAKLYIAFSYAGKVEQAKALAAELERVKSGQHLNIPPKRYVYTEYIPFQTRIQVNQAKQWIEEDRNEEALTLLESSLEIYDSHIAGRLIGEVCFKLQNNDKALYYFKKTYDQFKFDPEFLYNYTLIYLAGKDIENARKCLDEIRQLDPESKYLELLDVLVS